MRLILFFWIEGDLDYEISGVKVKGYGKKLKNFKEFLITQDPKKTILSCTDDVYIYFGCFTFQVVLGD